MNKVVFKLIALWWFLATSVLANHHIAMNTVLPGEQKMPPVKLHSLHLAPVNIATTIDQLAADDRIAWQLESSSHLAIQQGINWYKVVVHNASQQTASGYLTLGNDIAINSLDIYSVQPGFNSLNAVNQSQTTRLLPTNNRFTELILAPNEHRTLYIRLAADNELYRPLVVENVHAFMQSSGARHYQNAFAVGGIIAIAVMSLLLYVAVRDPALSWLSAYFFLRAILLSVLVGGHLYYLFPEHPELRGGELLALVALSTLAFIWFTIHLFQLKQQLPRFVYAAKWVSLGLVTISVFSFYMPPSLIVLATNILFISTLVVLFSLGLVLYRRQQRLAFLFSVIMAVQFVFGLLISLGLFFDVSPFNARESLLIASFLFNTTLIVFLICRMYYYQMHDKQLAQKEALTNALASQKAQAQLLNLQEENQEELEQRVQERTLELNIALNELEELNRELEQKNTIDELTGLYNRRFYDQRILAEYRRSKRNLTPLSLVVIDLDFFKRVNDKFGHIAGDQCLSWLAQHIKQSLKRSTDVGCRYGGEEFCLILPDTDQNGAIALAEELRKAVQSFDFVYQGESISLTVSCGVATYTQQENIAPTHIFCAADKALYQAKRQGRNQVNSQDISPDLLIQEHSHD
ncbi:GGDEF domain-containing protein [Thalassotalea euphylliae]|uniref:diguanylate cyclase n=1 Tax=Thalassotalea euphylliae TaxID=1655234 RepID=A0A3E0TVT2_9GAMM|nr:GGDEF domain-containing protein [Thalassotalea euphylliae]REL28698.1 GGDEF domain-containing protein [Thalassotalea euphylliae]